MRQEDATIITARCFHGEPASCSHNCPFFFDVRTFLARAKDGRWDLAYKLYRNATVFPGIVSELCEAPCRAECQRGPGGKGALLTGGGPLCPFVGDEPVDIRGIEAAAVRFAKDRNPEAYRIPPRDQRVAIVGAGLAGLSLALNLAQKAYSVTVFERGETALWTWARHPKYKDFLEEISLQFSSVEAGFSFNTGIAGDDDPALAGFSYIHDATGNEGIDPVTSIANSIGTSQAIEAFLQTGETHRLDKEGDRLHPARPEKRYLDHTGEPGKPAVAAADPKSGYTREEAAQEASRCMGCDCRACMDACEMLGRYNKRPQKIAIEAYADTKAVPPFSSCSLTRETYSCSLCGYCRSVCPADVDLEELFHMARAGRAETGKHPKAFHDFWLRDFEWHRGEGSYFVPGIPSVPGYIFFPGCKLGARSPSQVRDAAVLLKEKYGAGALLDCCGAPAYWAGEEAIFRAHLASLRSKWETAGKPVFIFACAYCMRLFGGFLPEIEKISLYELLASSGMAGVAKRSTETHAVFDPCTARSFPRMEESVREIARGAGITLTELPKKNHCCGFGGHMRTANPELYDTIAGHRSAADEAPYLVYCANCAEAFALAGKPHMHILDLVWENDGAEGRSLQQRRDNAAIVKSELMELFEGKASHPQPRPWDTMRVEIPSSLIADMDRRLILADDLKEAIYEAERSGEFFILPEEGGAPAGNELRQCSLVRDVMTTWVKWTCSAFPPQAPNSGSINPAQSSDRRPAEQVYTIVDAWAHRMRFSDTE